MGRKYKKKLVKVFSIFVSLLMVFALLPTAVNAADNTIYSADGIDITVDKGDIGVRTDISFTVRVDGVIVAEDVLVEDIGASSGTIHIAAEGYNVTFEENGMNITSLGDNTHLITITDWITDSYSCTINLATEKTKDDIKIANGETVYGKFLWSKQHASTSAYARDIEIYVNGEYAYTQTVNTPKELSNLIGVNKEFWFEPNLDLYNANYEMNRDYVNQVEKDLKIYLTTKCGCGLDTCLCEGGCDCTVNCPCEACQGTNLADNQINTGYGIITYKEPGSSGGYRLQVRINLNGQIVYTSDWLRVYVGLPGNLEFDPAQGYYYQKPNDYDINTLRSGSTWVEGTGQLSIVGITQEVRNYDNVLTINLVNFDNSVSLDVERRQGSPMNNVNGYRVSYEVNGVSYTYDYYNFGAAQTPNIPTNTPVTITAICNSPYEVNQWSTGNAHAGNVTLEGSEGENGTKAYGNSVTLTVNSANDAIILLYIDSLKTVEVPTDDDLINPETGLLKDNAVTIDCVNEQENHENKTYGLKEGTYTIGDLTGNSADGYTCDITITNPNSYVDDYNEVLKGHVLDPKEQNREITLRYVNGKWTVDEGEAPVKYTVKCETDPGTTIPEKPDEPTVEDLLKNNAVTIDCINNEVNHPNKTYGLLGKYTIGEVTSDETKGYKVDITVEPDEAYVIQYNEDTGVQHSLLPEQQEAKVITLVYDDGQWALEEGYTPVTYTVICDSDSGDQTDPSDPTNPDDDNPVNPGGDDGNQGGNDNTDDGNGNNTGNTNDNGNNSGNTNNNGSGNNAGQNGNQNVNNGNTTNGNGAGTNGTTSSTNSSQNPKTSDDSAIVTWMSLVVLAAGGIAVITKKTLKKNK